MFPKINVSHMTLFFLCQTALQQIMKQNILRYNATIADKWKQRFPKFAALLHSKIKLKNAYPT